MRPDIGLCEYGTAARGAWFASEAAQRWDGVAISPIGSVGSVGQDEGEPSKAAVVHSAAA
ncbi:hypothetical protein [Glycomyces sp. NPDC021274]|uniref:hypothetical protein n=1 Tax=Glycomyces sp. NPDC021274 TaxID=3155120 RepID=UPI0033EDF2B3